jgi:PAS domain S-box-containing protein
MSWLDGISLQRRLILIIAGICAIVLLLACTVLAIYEVIDFRRGIARDATVWADIVGANTQAALAFDDADAARKVLNTLVAETQIVGAHLYAGDGRLFADWARPGAALVAPAAGAPSEGSRFGAGILDVARPVIIDGKRLGTIHLRIDLQGMNERITLFAAIAGVALLGSFLLAVGLSARMQGVISRPILALAQTAQVVAEHHDYSVRAPAQSQREFAALTDAFNLMLTQIQRQSHALVESEERVRAIIDSALSAVVVMDAQGLVCDWNARAEQLFGWPRSEAIGRDLADTIIPTRYRDAHRKGLEHFAVAGAGPVLGRMLELSALRRDGSEFPVELSVSALKRGEAVSFCGFITDITGRKQAEAKLQAQIARLDLLSRITRAIGERQDLASIFQVMIRNLEDNLPIDFGCVLLYDRTTRQLIASNIGVRNPGLVQSLTVPAMAKFAADENGLARCVGGQLIYEPDISRLATALPRLLAGAGLRSMVAAPLVVESAVFGVLVTARLQPDSFGSADCEFLRQLSEQVALAAHQAQLHDALQHAYDDLRQSQQTVMQQERLRVLGQMASGIAHDINNAISPVALYTESLLEREPGLSERTRSYLETINRAIDDVAHTVARMREFYRQREPQLELAAVHLNQKIEQVLDLTRARWSDMTQQRGMVIDVRTVLAPDLPIVMGVASEIREALINLVFNAVDAMPEGGVLTLSTSVVQTVAGGRICAEVGDTGVGMDEETRRRCLEPFFTTKGERGTGLGLAMVYGTAQRHGADIEIDSAPGKGTRIRLLFPPAPEASSEASGPRPYARPSRMRILLVDDDPILLKSLRDILEGDGHVVTAVNQGQEGIDTFRSSLAGSERFDVVITDLGMPYVDGRKVSRTIKEASPRTPVILLTGWGQRLVAEGDIPEHVDCVLNKPPKLRELREALLKHVVRDGGQA